MTQEDYPDQTEIITADNLKDLVRPILLKHFPSRQECYYRYCRTDIEKDDTNYIYGDYDASVVRKYWSDPLNKENMRSDYACHYDFVLYKTKITIKRVTDGIISAPEDGDDIEDFDKEPDNRAFVWWARRLGIDQILAETSDEDGF